MSQARKAQGSHAFLTAQRTPPGKSDLHEPPAEYACMKKSHQACRLYLDFNSACFLEESLTVDNGVPHSPCQVSVQDVWAWPACMYKAMGTVLSGV